MGSLAGIVPAVRAAVNELDPTMPVFNTMTLREQIGQAMTQERSIAILISALGGLALLLAAVGIYGVMAYAVSQRTQEIGIRSALGASRQRILALVIRQGMTLTAVGVGIGIVGAAIASETVVTLLFGVSRLDPATYLGVALVLAAAAVLASWIPAARAAAIDPARTLRAE